MANTIKIGHASRSENSNDGTSGVGGDQTGKEVCIVDHYYLDPKKYDFVLRPKTKALAEKSARVCEDGCNNPNVGYSQINYGGRNSLERAASTVDYNLSILTTPCNTDCSAFMTFCAVAGGAGFPYYNSWGNAPVCSSMKQWFTQNGAYEVLDDANHTTITDFLKRGDILVDEDKHTIMVLENGCQIVESSSIKVALVLNDIKSTEISATATVSKIEDGEEKLITETDEIELYDWTYSATPLSNSGESLSSKKLELNAGTATFSLTDLTPFKSYILKVTAKEHTGEAELRSANVLFTTPYSCPTAVRNLTVNFSDMTATDAKCKITFIEPNSWGSSKKYSNGYRLYVVINGVFIGYSDSIILSGSSKVSKTILLSDVTKQINLKPNDCIQVGIQPWLKDRTNSLIFDTTALNCSQPFYIKHFSRIVSKIYVKIKDVFKYAVLYQK